MDSTLLRLLIMPRHWPAGVGMGVLYLINLLPYRIKIRLGKGIGRLAYVLVRRRRHIASVNLKLCFPELSGAERHQLIKRSFDNFGAGLIEASMGWWSDDSAIHDMTEYHGLEYLRDGEASGQGVLLIGAHFSSLELCSTLMSQHCLAHAVYRVQNNKLVNTIIERGRSKSVKGLISNRDGRKILKALRQGGIVWIAPDHDMGERLSVYAPFFGQPAATLSAPGRLAKMTGATTLFLSHHRNSDDSGYTVRFKPMPDNFNALDDVGCATIVNQMIAEHILIDPAQYYWFHRRFKSQQGRQKGSLYRGQVDV